MSKDLFVGDLHVQINNLEDSKKLFKFIKETFIENGCQRLILLGDVFHTHAVIRQEVGYAVLNFLKEFYYEVVMTNKTRIIIIAGNHDGISPKNTEQNALSLILQEYSTIVSGDEYLVMPDGYVFMPFMADQEKFLINAKNAFNTASKFTNIPVLICHQTFDGAAYENGMLCPDGIDSNLLPYTVIISGHIHKKQIVNDKVIYLGTPRQITAGEANEEKFIYIVTRKEDETISFNPISTNHIVKCYYVLDVDEFNLDKIQLDQYDFEKDDIRLRITGSESFYESVKKRYSNYEGKVKFIPNITRDVTKSTSIELNTISIEEALKMYIEKIADIENDLRGEVWNEAKRLMNIK